MEDKYSISFPVATIKKNLKRLTNQLWKLIPMRENGEEWKKQLNQVKFEIVGLSELFLNDPLFLQLLTKLEGLEITDTSFFDYRKTVFEAINLLQEVVKNEIDEQI